MKTIARKLIAGIRRRTGQDVEKIDVPRNFLHIHLIDTSIASDNIGDEIIVSAAKAALAPYLRGAYVTSSSSHDGLGAFGRGLVKNADIVLLLGTNAISHRHQLSGGTIWKVGGADMDVLRNKVVLVGCGASIGFDHVENRQREFLNTVLAGGYVHSVRDQLGKDIVESAGCRAVNTSCPTLWGYPWAGGESSRDRPDSVVFMLTKHKPHENDAIMVETLLSLYSNVAFWPQQPRDYHYLNSLGFSDGISIIPPSLEELDRFLDETKADVVGTRLHGGIRGLQRGCRAFVVSIDNRARGIGEHVGLQTIDRELVGSQLKRLLTSTYDPKLRMPAHEISIFLGQLGDIKRLR